MPILRTWWGQLLVAVFAVAALQLLITLMPVAHTGTILLREALLVAGSIALMLVLLRFGSVTAAEMGWRRPTWASFGWALLGALAIFIGGAITAVLMVALGLTHSFHQSTVVLNSISAKPLWMLALIALTAAISEEILFRAVVLNYLAIASGRVWIGAVVSLVVFAAMHANGWGWGKVLPTLVPGGVLTLSFVWKRDLGLNMIAHFMVDLTGLVAAAIVLHHA